MYVNASLPVACVACKEGALVARRRSRREQSSNNADFASVVLPRNLNGSIRSSDRLLLH